VDYFYRVMRYPRVKRKNITPLFRMKAAIMGMAPATPIYNPHKLEFVRNHWDISFCISLRLVLIV
jgi:hypothetical protein